MGGLCTAITQNVADLLTTTAVESMLCNSEFLMLLNLKENERHLLETELGISPNLMQYISNPDCGCGLLKFGNRVIPCDGRLPKDSAMLLSGKLNDVPSGRLFRADFGFLQMCQSL
ncbi:hypothetical protein ACTQ1N_11020 [Porcincola sp. LCP21S3_C12]|uniref:hypothetical protein n=1 Tax=Porcincola sp. LCP21S3_C12 TaxID=3438798 RepID=UPI003F9B5B50